ncbi:universal stress protein [Winogradskyella sp.]|uniref:universal stress protein n=1 Tax=Winogradskyella sp. TaxID=1883156 RepID=UPI003F6A8C40
MKNILLLTDFSDNSINAINYALKLFSGSICNFYLFHVELSNTYLSDDLMAGGTKSIYDSLVKKSKTQLKTLLKNLKSKSKHEDFEFEMLIDHDVFTDAIKQVVDLKQIELIVMGTNGITGAKEVVFGSNTINVIRKVYCPTLVIPEDFEYRAPNQVLLPLDLYDALSGDAFTAVLNFTKRFGKKLHMVRVNPNNEDAVEQEKDKQNIDTLLTDLDFEYHMVTDIPMPQVVDSYVQINNIQITTLLVQEESLFERFFIGSPTTKISNKLRVPLLVFHS